ncbi:MAG: tRNA pseudouridine(38-40) synthase TruA [Betaproteobacteria bacterium]|nr:tRNA pseudouridine(38-40) synthase TruA [Betaproteobacteria bacterium]
MRLALGVEYDGSRFCGWQSQPSGCGVQDALERALTAIASEPIRVVTAGRTDTGVHALHQIVHFDTGATRPDSAWVRGVNALLPDSVGVLWARPVNEEFHARFSAVSRRYLYLLHNHPVRPALLSGKVGWFHQPLDVEAMRQGAQYLLGEHDFSAFRAAECQAKSPVKHIQNITVAQDSDYVLFEFTANAFLHHMVRNLVGSLVYVGKGKHPPAWIGELLGNRDRTCSAPTFAPDGLYLAEIGYEAEWGIPVLSRMPDFAFR